MAVLAAESYSKKEEARGEGIYYCVKPKYA